jgi:hypothetical protein
VQQNCRQEKEEEEDTFRSKEEEETELFYKKLAFLKGNENKNKVLNTFVKKNPNHKQQHKFCMRKQRRSFCLNTDLQLPRRRLLSSLARSLARWRPEDTHMRLNSSAQRPKSANLHIRSAQADRSALHNILTCTKHYVAARQPAVAPCAKNH